MSRSLPNILITGTPGTGKSTLAQELANQSTQENSCLLAAGDTQEKPCLIHLDCASIIETQQFHDGWDEQRDCHILDEDRLLDYLEEKIGEQDGGVVVDYHGCEFFPERWFDGVFVLRTDNTVLYDRLKLRGYSESKIRENVECEIFGTLVDEAKDSYKPEIVQELQNNSVEDMERNINDILKWVVQWRKK